MMAATEHKHVDRPARWECTADITVVDHAGRELFARLGNISQSGFMAEAKAPPRAGARVTLVLPFGESVAATVRWSLNGRFGCRLDGAFTGRQMLALSVLAGVRVSSLLLLALLVVGVWR